MSTGEKKHPLILPPPVEGINVDLAHQELSNDIPIFSIAQLTDTDEDGENWDTNFSDVTNAGYLTTLGAASFRGPMQNKIDVEKAKTLRPSYLDRSRW
ncbi:hypothetical protein DFH09DRAFT_1312444 [Mycena vulgaris]|nr:hypothetical protein DFH09DRAFT_1312444 [Mycena vulgaris]